MNINDRNYVRQRGARKFGLVKIEDNLEAQRGKKFYTTAKIIDAQIEMSMILDLQLSV